MICEYCGMENDDRADFCINCGRGLSADALGGNDQCGIDGIEGKDIDCKDIDGNDIDSIGFSTPGSFYIGPIIDDDTKDAAKPDYDGMLPDSTNGLGKLSRMLQKHGKLIYRLLTLATVLIILLKLSIVTVNYPFTFVSKNTIQAFTDYSTKKTYVYDSKGDILHTIDTPTIVFQYSPDLTSAILISSYSNKFYYVNKEDLIKFDGNVSIKSMSDDGRYFLYTDTNSDYYCSLKCYDTKTKTEKVLNVFKNDNTSNSFYGNLTFSPNGKTLAFNQITYPTPNIDNYNEQNQDLYFIESYVSINGQDVVTYAKNDLIKEISDNGEYVYHRSDLTEELLVRHDGKDLKLADGVEALYLNRDYSEAVLGTQNSIDILIRGKEFIKISDVGITEILVPKLAWKNTDYATTLSIDTFQNKVLSCQDGTLRLITKDYTTKIIADDVLEKEAYISKDGNNIIYRNSNNSIVSLKDITGECRRETVIQKADRFVVTSDLSNIYYIDQGNLYYKTKKSEPVKIASEVKDLLLEPQEDILYFIKNDPKTTENGTLFYLRYGGKVKQVTDIPGAYRMVEWYQGFLVFEKSKELFNLYLNTYGTHFGRMDSSMNEEKLKNELGVYGITKYLGMLQ